MHFHNLTKPIEGILKIEFSRNDGKRSLHFEDRNVITLASKQALLSGLYLENVISDPINQLRVGTGGSIDPQGLFPKEVNQNMDSLFDPILTVSTTFVTDNDVPSVTFLADLDQGMGNDMLINEAALYKTSGLMFNIKTFPAIPKTREFNVHFSWTIIMV